MSILQQESKLLLSPKVYESLSFLQKQKHLARLLEKGALYNYSLLTGKNIEFLSKPERLHLAEEHMLLAKGELPDSLSFASPDKKVADRDFLPHTIYLDNLRSASNVGNILRTAEALRIGGAVFGGYTPNAEHPKVIKSSMGSSKLLPTRESINGPIIILETSESATPLYDFHFPEVFTLVLGNEALGVSEKLSSEADYLVKIPLYGLKGSLNVANAFAICAQEIAKQQHVLRN